MDKKSNVEEMVVASFYEVEELIKQGYTCISSVGNIYGKYSPLNDKMVILDGVSTTYGMFYQLTKGKDYMCVFQSYSNILEKLGIGKIVKDIEALKAKKIAICGYPPNFEFCYRYILAENLRFEIGVKPTTVKGVSYRIILENQQKMWHHDIYKERGHFDKSDNYVGQALLGSKWITSKATKNPHQYTLRKDFGDDEKFLALVKHIRCLGEFREFWGIIYRQFDYNGYSYWTMPEDYLDEDCNLINRAKI